MLIGADNIGWSAPYAAWTEGFTSFPRWFQATFAVLGAPTVVAGLVGLGVAAQVGGRPLLMRVAGWVVASLVAASAIVQTVIWI
jgi:hypothetical protein